MDKDPFTLDLFGEEIIPEKLSELCYSSMPDLSAELTVCLTGYFACARGSLKRVEIMQKSLRGLQITVTENWNRDIDILIVGYKAKIISEKIKNAIRRNIPIVKETDFLQYARLLQ